MYLSFYRSRILFQYPYRNHVYILHIWRLFFPTDYPLHVFVTRFPVHINIDAFALVQTVISRNVGSRKTAQSLHIGTFLINCTDDFVFNIHYRLPLV